MILSLSIFTLCVICLKYTCRDVRFEAVGWNCWKGKNEFCHSFLHISLSNADHKHVTVAHVGSFMFSSCAFIICPQNPPDPSASGHVTFMVMGVSCCSFLWLISPHLQTPGMPMPNNTRECKKNKISVHFIVYSKSRMPRHAIPWNMNWHRIHTFSTPQHRVKESIPIIQN